MEPTIERKRRYIRDIQKAHPHYLPDTYIAQRAGKAMEKLPEQAVWYLWLMLGKKQNTK